MTHWIREAIVAPHEILSFCQLLCPNVIHQISTVEPHQSLQESDEPHGSSQLRPSFQGPNTCSITSGTPVTSFFGPGHLRIHRRSTDAGGGVRELSSPHRVHRAPDCVRVTDSKSRSFDRTRYAHFLVGVSFGILEL